MKQGRSNNTLFSIYNHGAKPFRQQANTTKKYIPPGVGENKSDGGCFVYERAE